VTCPQCRRRFVRRSHKRGGAELLLSLVYVYPFRCQYCGHRFRAWQPGRRDTSQAPERREYERIPADIAVRLSGLPGSARGRAIELSINGCTVDTDVMLANGAQVEVTLEPGPGARPITVPAAVVHSIRANAAGLVFTELAAPERERLRRLVHDLASRGDGEDGSASQAQHGR
jgi:rubredoxin